MWTIYDFGQFHSNIILRKWLVQNKAPKRIHRVILVPHSLASAVCLIP